MQDFERRENAEVLKSVKTGKKYYSYADMVRGENEFDRREKEASTVKKLTGQKKIKKSN